MGLKNEASQNSDISSSSSNKHKSLCDYILLPMEMNSKYMHELIVLALKLGMSEVFPGPRTNYSEPSAVPRAKVIMWVSPSWPYGPPASSATYLQELNRAEAVWTKKKASKTRRLQSIFFFFFTNNNICASHFTKGTVFNEGGRKQS